MKWYGSLKDKLPAEGQIILLHINGVDYIATYDDSSKNFLLINHGGSRVPAVFENLYWTDYDLPPTD